MSILFTFSKQLAVQLSLAVPLCLLAYKSVIKAKSTGQSSYGQWFCLILFTLLSNLLYYFAQNSKLYLLGDLCCKLAICLLPSRFNTAIETKISYLHLQILSLKMRSAMIQKMYKLHSFFTQLTLSHLDEVEKKLFKKQLMCQLTQERGETQLGTKIMASCKQYAHVGITCDLISSSTIEREKQRVKQPMLEASFAKNKTNLHLIEEETDNKVISLRTSKKNSFLIHKSHTDLGIDDKEETQFKEQDGRLGKHQTQQPPITRKGATISREFEDQEPSMILDRLDVSEYSDMFQDADQDDRDKGGDRLLTKVEAIIEIGTGSTARLEIYNIELYSNDQIRLVSLYGREFERHKLLAMTTQKHGYYELKLEGGKINTRRVKFRGNIQPFVKFLKSSQN